METYRKEQKKQKTNSRVAGGTLALCLLVFFYVFLILHGFKYLDPPPPDESPITLDFMDIEEELEEIKPEVKDKGETPAMENPDPEKEVDFVKRAEATEKGKIENKAKESKIDDFGDVEKKDPPREEINEKSLFTNAKNKANKDTLTSQKSIEPGDKVDTGHAGGNITDGKTTGTPNAKVAGRTVVGSLGKPSYTATEEGKVVVKIKVDRNGNVVEAQPGEAGTNLNSKAAWEAAKKVAMKAKFNVKADAPEFQYGTITYIFNITQ